MQNRWKSKVLWASIVVQIIAIGQLVGLWQLIGVDAGLVGDVAAGILGLLVTIGIINNPTNKHSF